MSDVRSRSPHQQRVDEFMKLAKQGLPDKPTLPGPEVRKLRANLILEEALETIEQLGCQVVVNDEYWITPKDDILSMEVTGPGNLEGIADGCADISVVTTGTLSACGIADEAVQTEVDINNLKKFGPGHSYREDGKLIKPPGHKPPAIGPILEAQGMRVSVPKDPSKCFGEEFNPADEECQACPRRADCIEKFVEA